MGQGPLVAVIVMAGLLAITVAWQVFEIGKERARAEDGATAETPPTGFAKRLASVEQRLERVERKER